VHVLEAPWRRLERVTIACDRESDLGTISDNLNALGIRSTITDGGLETRDPVNDVAVRIEPAAPVTPPPAPNHAAHNVWGEVGRTNERAPVVAERLVGENPPAPRRLGHFVLGSENVEKSRQFWVDALGFRLSDAVSGPPLYFLRCSGDHHNLLLMPSPVNHLNHYAFECDDVDMIGQLGRSVLDADQTAHVVGIGRHVIGSNVFWYLKDPAGTMFEFFTDMDQLDPNWIPRTDWTEDVENMFSCWGPPIPPPEFFEPADLDAIAQARASVRS